MWHFSSSGGPFECDIEKSLMADFALSGELIHTRWFSLLVKRKPDTKTEMKSLRCRTGLNMCGRACVGVSVFFFFFFLSSLKSCRDWEDGKPEGTRLTDGVTGSLCLIRASSDEYLIKTHHQSPLHSWIEYYFRSLLNIRLTPSSNFLFSFFFFFYNRKHHTHHHFKMA